MGSIPVTACCPKKPRIESMARRPFLISFSFFGQQAVTGMDRLLPEEAEDREHG